MNEHYYAEFLYPGIIVSDSSLKEITAREYENPKLIIVPKGSFGFRVMHRTEVITENDALLGQYKGTSGWYYVGKKTSKEEIKQTMGEESILYKNMENNHYNFVVLTEFGQAMPLRKNDVVMERVV